MSSVPPQDSAAARPLLPAAAEVRYALPVMLEELKAERAASTFAMEKFSQGEIEKLFKAKAARHGKNRK